MVRWNFFFFFFLDVRACGVFLRFSSFSGIFFGTRFQQEQCWGSWITPCPALEVLAGTWRRKLRAGFVAACSD